MTNQVLFRGSISSTHKDDSLPDGVNNIITIINSLFLNNERGVQFIGGNVTGSSFYNTEVTASGRAYIVYLDNNFWNSSEPTYVYSPTISCDTWLVPALVTDNASGPVQTIKLVYLAFNGTDYSYYDVSKVPIFDVNANLTVSNGVINPNKGIFNTDGLTANYTYNGVGNQTVTATLSDGNILKLNVTFYRIDTFTNMTISNNAPQTGDYITVNVVVRDKNGKLLNGSVNVYLNSVLKGTISLINGMGSFDVLAEKTGPCEIFVNYTGDLDNSYSSNMTIVSVKNTQMNVSVSDSDSASNVTFTVDFDHVANGFVFVTIGGVTYNATVSGKEAKVIVPPLAVGKYDAIVSYNGVVNKTVAVNISPDRNPVLNISDIVMIYKDGTRMVAVLTDYKSNPIANATVYFSINGVTYVRTTDVNGSASIGLNLGSGVYGASVYYNGSDMYDKVSKNITVTINPTVLADDLVKMYKNATKFSAKFTDSTGKALVNSDVRFNINGVFYTRTTDANGVASLAINLRPGDYILTAYNPVNGEQKGVNISQKYLIVQNYINKYNLHAYVYEGGYVKLMDFSKGNGILMILGLLLLTVSLCSVFTQDYETGQKMLLQATLLGRKKMAHKKILVSVFIIIISFGIIYLSQFITFYRLYGLVGITEPVGCMGIQSGMEIPIWLWLVFGYVIRLIIMLAYSGFFLFISNKIKSAFVTLTVMSIVIIIIFFVI